ncbi:hypothetical protein [Testudinid alphaherpesvirus 3]|uniref:Uncharacterized protein n=1 Tax=Testudinid alphaherpesvirus 3 TaxID=2560801 RepID=A0A0K1R1U5_9ALPH|nr:hypothetical protein [Testudinid alphaherpesvirus 3]
MSQVVTPRRLPSSSESSDSEAEYREAVAPYRQHPFILFEARENRKHVDEYDTEPDTESEDDEVITIEDSDSGQGSDPGSDSEEELPTFDDLCQRSPSEHISECSGETRSYPKENQQEPDSQASEESSDNDAPVRRSSQPKKRRLVIDSSDDDDEENESEQVRPEHSPPVQEPKRRRCKYTLV